VPLDALREAAASVEDLGLSKAPAKLLQCLKGLAARNEKLLDEGKSFSGEVRDFRLGLEISVIQSFAGRIVRMLKVRDPLSERVHLGSVELILLSLGGIASETLRRAMGRRGASRSTAGA
jgi:hydroxysqualene synthase